MRDIPLESGQLRVLMTALMACRKGPVVGSGKAEVGLMRVERGARTAREKATVLMVNELGEVR